MRVFKLVSTFAVVMALTAIAATTASAAIEFLPGAAKTAFTGTSAEAVLQVKGGAAIKCTKSEVATGNGELLSSKTLLFIVDFTGCKTLGLPINSLGDKAEVILVHVEGETCTVSTSPLVGAVLLKPLPLHLEVPSVGTLLLVEGKFVGGLEPPNKSTKEYKLAIAQKEGKQGIEGCLNAAGTKVEPETLTTSENGKAAVASAEEAKSGTLVFTTTAQEFMT
jgi:hypothetical protein